MQQHHPERGETGGRWDEIPISHSPSPSRFPEVDDLPRGSLRKSHVTALTDRKTGKLFRPPTLAATATRADVRRRRTVRRARGSARGLPGGQASPDPAGAGTAQHGRQGPRTSPERLTAPPPPPKCRWEGGTLGRVQPRVHNSGPLTDRRTRCGTVAAPPAMRQTEEVFEGGGGGRRRTGPEAGERWPLGARRAVCAPHLVLRPPTPTREMEGLQGSGGLKDATAHPPPPTRGVTVCEDGGGCNTRPPSTVARG